MKRTKRLSPEFLKQLRTKRIVVVHPNDADGGVLLLQLQRIGCQVQTYWPAPVDLADSPDIVFCAVQPELSPGLSDWLQTCEEAIVIGIISYENPTVFEKLLALGASWVLMAPIRSSGVLTALLMTVIQHQEMQLLRKRVSRLEQKLLSNNDITLAKSILVQSRGISDAEAYKVIREQAMAKRIPVEDIARALINAHDLLSK